MYNQLAHASAWAFLAAHDRSPPAHLPAKTIAVHWCAVLSFCCPPIHNKQEKFQPYFADAGYDSWAVSLRGQGGSDRVQGVAVAGEALS